MALDQSLLTALAYLGAAVCGVILGGILGFIAGNLYIDLMKISPMEGTASYMVVLLFMPGGAFLGMVTALIGLAVCRHYYW
ncbi:hypothetical protein [Methylobacterium mesophilicum]|uniref:hypothetical protein n=1 Tax=Methylobacterium mesophilicum TaxID=39956 RepID=UPI002F35B4A4